MSCGLPGGLEVHFLDSGVRLEPYGIDSRSEKGMYDYAKVHISKKAGEVVAANTSTGEPVHVLVGGTVHGRYVLPQNSLSIGTDDTKMELYDAEKILTSGAISKTFHQATLDEVVGYIFERVDDPYGVLTDYSLVRDTGLPEYAVSVKQNITEWFFNEDYDPDEYTGLLGTVRDIETTMLSWLELLPLIDLDNYEISLEEATPKEAMDAVADTFGIEYWVDREGVLWVGIPTFRPTRDIGITSDDHGNEPYALSDYNVTLGDTPVKTVVVRGKTRWYKDRNGSGENDGAHLYPQAIVSTELDDGLITADPEPLNLQSLAAIEYAAQTRFVNEWTEYKSGNIILNGLASQKQQELATLDVGSLLAVTPSFLEHCDRPGEGGLFTVRRVQHTINRRRGWKVTVEVAGIPESLTVKSNLVDRQDGTTYPDYDSFVKET